MRATYRKHLVWAGLALALSCGPDATSLLRDEELGEAQSALTQAEHLRALALAQADERAASRALQLLVEPRRQRALDQESRRRLVVGLSAKNPNHPNLSVVRKTILDEDAAIAAYRSRIVASQTTHRDRAKRLSDALTAARPAALTAAQDLGKSGAFPFEVAIVDFSFGLSQQVPTLHTEVQRLWADPACRGDLILEGLLDAYLRATIAETDLKAAAAIEAFQHQLSCLSQRQLRLLEGAMVQQTERTLARLVGTRAPVFSQRFRELMAGPIVLIADQTRGLSFSKPGLRWLAQHQQALMQAASLQGSLLNRAGVFIIDPRRHQLLTINSKAQRATSKLSSPLATRLLVIRDAKGSWSSNLLPAFLQAITGPCFGADLVLEGTGVLGEKLTCDQGCGAALKDASWLAKGFSVPLSRSTRAAKECPTSGTTSTSGGSATDSTSPAGTGGVTLGSTASRANCVMDAVMDARTGGTADILSCLGTLHPASGKPGLLNPGLSGGKSCNPSVAQGEGDWPFDENNERVFSNGCDKQTGFCDNQYMEYWDPEDGLFHLVDVDTEEEVTVNDAPADPTNPLGGTGGGGGSSTGGGGGSSTGGGTGGTAGGGSGTTGGGSGTTGGGSGTTGGGSGGGTGGGGGSTGGGGGSTCEGGGWPCEGETESDCADDPECRDSELESCSDVEGSCSGGCTGQDNTALAFHDCAFGSARTGTPSSMPGSADPNVILTSPDDTTTGTSATGVLACMAGGVGVNFTCSLQSVALCLPDQPNCGCTKSAVVVPNLSIAQCEAMQCTNMSSTQGEALMSAPSGAGACGCSSVLGG